MDARKRWIVGGTLALVVVVGTTGFAIANAGDDDRPLTGPALDQASAAAVEYIGGGTVIESEVGDDGAAYGVEVRRDDGSVVEVSLDADFQVLGHESDDDGTRADDDGAGED